MLQCLYVILQVWSVTVRLYLDYLFRRSVLTNKAYVCGDGNGGNGLCKLAATSGIKRCQNCRYKACIRRGMSPEYVQQLRLKNVCRMFDNANESGNGFSYQFVNH